MSDSLQPHRLQLARHLCPWNSPGKNTGLGCHSLLQGIFPTRDWIQVFHIAHCRLVLYHLGHKGSPRTLQWIAYSFSKGSSSLPRNWTWVSCITDRFFASWATKEACIYRLCCCSVAQSHPNLCDRMTCNTAGILFLHKLPELAQTPAHWAGDDIQPSCPLSCPSSSAFSLSQHLFLF